MADKKEIMIAMDPAMAQKFAASSHVSCKYGVIVNKLTLSYHCSEQRYLGKHAQNFLEATMNYGSNQSG